MVSYTAKIGGDLNQANKKGYLMKVFVVGARGFPDVPGGIEKACKELYKRLAKYNNIEITALVISKYYKNKIKEWNGVRFIYIKSVSSKNFEKLFYGFIASLIAIIKKPDIVHFQATNCTIYIPLLKLFGIKTVTSYRSMDFLYPKWSRFGKFIIKMSDKAAFKSDKIIAVSNTVKEHVKKYTDKVVLIPNGININHHELSKDEENRILSSYGLFAKGYIFFAGRFTPEKAIENLITAYTRLNNNFKLVIAGDAYQENKYSRMIKNLAKQSEDVILTGFITGRELQTLFSNAKLFVLPSKHEGLPHVLLEALSYGVEVLASDIEANMQVDLDKDNFFKQGNIEDLKRKMVRFLNTDITEEEKLRRFEILKRDYDWDEITKKTYKIYEELT